MEVINKLIDSICDLMITNTEDRRAMHIAVKNCEAMGFIGIHELRQLTERGLPIVTIYSTILRIPTPVGAQNIKDRQMTYSDLLCIIGIIAQDIMVRSQKK